MYRELNPASRTRGRRQRLRRRLPRSRGHGDAALARPALPRRPGSTRRDDGGPGRRSTVEHGRLRHGSKRGRRSPTTTAASPGTRAWSSPGCGAGEHLESEIELAPRAPILAADGTPLAEGEADAREHPLGSAAIDVTGEVGDRRRRRPAGAGPPGLLGRNPGRHQRPRAGLQRAAGRQAGRLAARRRRRGRLGPRARQRQAEARRAGEDDDRPGPAVSPRSRPWPGARAAIAVLDARNGDVRALAGQAFSAPQPPGSTFKMITTTAALEKGVVSLDDEFEITNGVNVGGRFINNANGEYCGGTFREAFAESCNADFAPLGPKIGNDDLVETAERFGFNSPPDPLRAADRARSRTRRIDDPDRDRRRNRPRRDARSARAKCWRRRWRWRASRRRSATTACAMPTSIVANKKLRPDAKPVRVMSKKIADELTELMIGVVTEGTGYAGAIPEAQVAGKTGTAELGPEAGPGELAKPGPDQGRLVRGLRPRRKGEAGDRRAADRSRSRRRRSRRPGRLRSPLGRALSA